jgi:hypothetical protein
MLIVIPMRFIDENTFYEVKEDSIHTTGLDSTLDMIHSRFISGEIKLE